MTVPSTAVYKINQAIDRQLEIFPKLKTKEIESLRQFIKEPVILFDTDKKYVVMADKTGAVKVGNESVFEVIGVLLETFQPDFTGVINASDSVLTGFEKSQGQINTLTSDLAGLFATKDTDDLSEGVFNWYYTGARVLSEIIAGLSFVNSAIANGDSLTVAIGKAQGQIDQIVNDISALQAVGGLPPVPFESFSAVQDSSSTQTWIPISGITFTATENGEHIIESMLYTQMNTAGYILGIAVYIDGVLQAGTQKNQTFQDTGFGWHFFRGKIALTAGQVVTLQAKRETAGAAAWTINEKYLFARRVT